MIGVVGGSAQDTVIGRHSRRDCSHRAKGDVVSWWAGHDPDSSFNKLHS